MSTSLSRRRVLRGMISGVPLAIALPRLNAMLDGNGVAYASGKPLPRRFGVWAFANGVHLDRWVPKETGTAWELPDELTPLAAIRPHVSVVSGMDLPFGGRPHASGNTVLMTSANLKGVNDNTYTARRPSIDQLVADEIGRDTPLRSIEIGVDDGAPPEKGTAFHWWSHNGPNSPNPCSYDCREVFARLFRGGVVGDVDAVAAAEREQRSILDAVLVDARALQGGLGLEDRRRVDQHMDGIRAIERRIVRRKQIVCTAPEISDDLLIGPTNGIDYEPRGTRVNQVMAELLAMALSCDLTRVFTYQLAKPGSRIGVNRLGFRRYHDITHGEPGDQPMCTSAVKFFLEELVVLVKALERVPEGGGTLLDNCAMLAAPDCTNPKAHGHKDFPMIVVGHGGGKIRTGVHHRGKGENACAVLLSLARTTGAKVPTFGEGTGQISAGLPAIEV